MFSVVKNVLECFELHLRGSTNLKFSGKPAPNPTSKASFVFIQYTKMYIYPGNYHLFFLHPPLLPPPPCSYGHEASLARQAFLITPLHDARYKTGKKRLRQKVVLCDHM